MNKTSIGLNKPKITLYSRNKNIQGTKPAGNFCYYLLKSILITVKTIRGFSDHYIFSWIYNHYKYFLAVETYDIIMATYNVYF